MTDANDIRRIMNLMEAEYRNPNSSEFISYSTEEVEGKISKIIATLKAKVSEKYTKLGRNLLRIAALEKEIKTLKEEAKAESKELIQDLFNAEDIVSTRVVDTVGFLFEMSKNPKDTETYKYAEILKEFQQHLTPELIVMLNGIKEKFKTVTPKSPSLKAFDKAQPQAESLGEGVGDKLKSFFGKFLAHVSTWGKNYDAKLNALKAQMDHPAAQNGGWVNDDTGYVD